MLADAALLMTKMPNINPGLRPMQAQLAEQQKYPELEQKVQQQQAAKKGK